LLRDDQLLNASTFRMTAIIQPESEFAPLPATRDELKAIGRQVPKEWLVALGDSSKATREKARSNLRDSSIVHFTCHGVQDVINPLNSGLILADGRLKVSELMRTSDAELKSGLRLAFLSACETAKGDKTVPDEALHLTATLLFAGFRGVVGTMW
jgi:CHAT domain-containing protein